jgi:hypothetical protein
MQNLRLETATWSIPQINPALIVPRARNNYCAGVFEDGKVLTKNYELVQRLVVVADLLFLLSDEINNSICVVLPLL